MNNIFKTLIYATVLIIPIIAVLLLALVFGWVTADEFRDALGKVVVVVGVGTLAVIATILVGHLIDKD